MTDVINHTRTEKLLLEAGRIFNSTLEYEELLESVLRLVMTAVHAEAALVFRVDHNRSDVKIRLTKSSEDRMHVFHRDLGAGAAGWVARYREPLIINDAENDARVDRELEEIVDIRIRSLICVPLIGKGHMIGVVEAINKQNSGFTEADMDILTGLNNQMAVAIDNAHLYRELKRQVLEKELLYEVGKKLASSLSLNETLDQILGSLKQVIDYNVGGVFLVDPDKNEVKSIYTVGYDKDVDDKLQLKIGQGLIGHVATSGEAIIVPDVSGDLRYINAHPQTRSEIVVPIKIEDRLIGVINLESEQTNAYDDHSLSLISAFATHAAISIERARLYESLLAKNKLDEQLNIARTIQRDFLPPSDPTVRGYNLSGTNISLGQVGGDYYDFIKIVDDQTGVAIADVSGKGIPASLIMAAFRASLIAEIRNNYSIRTIVEKANRLLCESLEPGNFVTAVYGVLDSKNHIFTYANCGHNLPVLVRANGTVEYLREGGPVLGVSRESLYREQALMLHPGELIVFYTDGVTEAFNEKEEDFGLDRLVDVILAHRTAPAREIQEAIYKAVTEFASHRLLLDDLTMVVLKRSVN